MNWQAIYQSWLQALGWLVIAGFVTWVWRRWKVIPKSDERLTQIEKDMAALDARLTEEVESVRLDVASALQDIRDDIKQSKQERKGMMYALMVSLDCHAGNKPNGDLTKAKDELHRLVFGVGVSTSQAGSGGGEG
jgi:hypothetical protein